MIILTQNDMKCCGLDIVRSVHAHCHGVRTSPWNHPDPELRPFDLVDRQPVSGLRGRVEVDTAGLTGVPDQEAVEELGEHPVAADADHSVQLVEAPGVEVSVIRKLMILDFQVRSVLGSRQHCYR